MFKSSFECFFFAFFRGIYAYSELPVAGCNFGILVDLLKKPSIRVVLYLYNFSKQPVLLNPVQSF